MKGDGNPYWLEKLDQPVRYNLRTLARDMLGRNNRERTYPKTIATFYWQGLAEEVCSSLSPKLDARDFRNTIIARITHRQEVLGQTPDSSSSPQEFAAFLLRSL